MHINKCLPVKHSEFYVVILCLFVFILSSKARVRLKRADVGQSVLGLMEVLIKH